LHLLSPCSRLTPTHIYPHLSTPFVNIILSTSLTSNISRTGCLILRPKHLASHLYSHPIHVFAMSAFVDKLLLSCCTSACHHHQQCSIAVNFQRLSPSSSIVLRLFTSRRPTQYSMSRHSLASNSPFRNFVISESPSSIIRSHFQILFLMHYDNP